MRQIVAIVGTGTATPAQEALAEELGELAIEAGFRVCCGGLGGVMAAACRGARRAARYREGDTLGFLPGAERSAADPHVDIVIPTNLGIARNALVVSAAHAVIAVGGSAGTLSEMAMAWELGRVVVALESGGEWSEKLAGERIDERREDAVLRARTPAEAVALAVEALRARG